LPVADRVQYKVALLMFMVNNRCPVYLSESFNQSAATEYVNVFVLPAA